MHITQREREVICALREMKYGKLHVVFQNGQLDHITTEVTTKLGQPASAAV